MEKRYSKICVSRDYYLYTFYNTKKKLFFTTKQSLKEASIEAKLQINSQAEYYIQQKFLQLHSSKRTNIFQVHGLF